MIASRNPHYHRLSQLIAIDAPSSDNGKIRDSNKIMLISALKDLNIPSIIDGGTAKDE